MTQKDGPRGNGGNEGNSGDSGNAGKGRDSPGTDGGTEAAAGDVIHLRPPKPCPACGKPSTREAFPFCSARCADVDLNRWLSGQYVVPGRPLEDGDEDES